MDKLGFEIGQGVSVGWGLFFCLSSIVTEFHSTPLPNPGLI